MRIILLEDIPGVGRKNEVKDLKPGHARSFLVNKKRAIVATPDALRAIEKRHLQEKQDAEIKSVLTLKTLEQLSDKKVVMREKVNDAGAYIEPIAVVVAIDPS
jgi:large subunit ribosomal protein L9